MNSRNSNKNQLKNNSTLENSMKNSIVSLKSINNQHVAPESRQSSKSKEVEIDTTYKKPLIFFLDLKNIQSDDESFKNETNSSIFSSSKKQPEEEFQNSIVNLKQDEQQRANSTLESPSLSLVVSIHSKNEFDKNHLNVDGMRSIFVNDIPTVSRSMLTQKSPSPNEAKISRKSFGAQAGSIEWKKSSTRQIESRTKPFSLNENTSKSFKSIGVSPFINESNSEFFDKEIQVDDTLRNEFQRNVYTNTEMPDLPKQSLNTTFIAKSSKAVKVVTDLKSRNIIIKDFNEESTLKKLFFSSKPKESEIKHEKLNSKLVLAERQELNELEELDFSSNNDKQYRSVIDLKSSNKNSFTKSHSIELPDIKKRNLWWNVSPSNKRVPKSDKLEWKSLTRIDSGFIYD
jgi:hypothetical protein